jgi:peptidyl-prolyl cis-trans isomerase C
MKRGHWAVSLALCACCSAPAEFSPNLPAPSNSTLPEGIVATVGSLPIRVENVAAVARAQQISVREALECEIRDALGAQGALHMGVDQDLLVQAALRGALGRVSLEALKNQAAERELENTEIAEATAHRFVELDRPETFRVIHAFVKVPPKPDETWKIRARALAERLAERVAKAADESEFKNLASSVDANGLEIGVETLKPVAADGRVVDVDHPTSGEMYTASFARAASRLTEAGQKSGVISTEFGFHVMMLLDRTPARALPLEERKHLVEGDIMTERAAKLKEELLRRIKSTVSVSVERSADNLLATIDVNRHEAP